VPDTNNSTTFSLSGPGEIVATDNGDPSDLTAFSSRTRNALSGMALVIIRSKARQPGKLVITARSGNLSEGKLIVTSSVQ
jgi:beta-galactosidase